MYIFWGTKFTSETFVTVDDVKLDCTLTGSTQLVCIVKPTTAGSFPVIVRDRKGGFAMFDGISNDVEFE